MLLGCVLWCVASLEVRCVLDVSKGIIYGCNAGGGVILTLCVVGAGCGCGMGCLRWMLVGSRVVAPKDLVLPGSRGGGVDVEESVYIGFWLCGSVVTVVVLQVRFLSGSPVLGVMRVEL